MRAIASPMRDVERAIGLAREVVDARAVRVTDFEDAMFVLRSGKVAPIHAESGHGAQWNTLVIGDSVVDLHGDVHYERRRMLTEVFKRSAQLASYERDLLIPAYEDMLRKLRAPGRTRAEIDIVRVARLLLVRVTMSLVGIEIGSDAEVEAFERLLAEVEYGNRSKFAADPEAAARIGLAGQARLVAEYLEPELAKRDAMLAREAAGEGTDDGSSHDLLTVMARHRAHYDAIGPDAMVRDISLLLVASMGSTSNGVCFAVWHLLEWLKEHPDQVDRRNDPQFLRRCFNESLRIGQSTVLMRTVLEDLVLPSGAALAAGDVLIIDRPASNASLLELMDVPEESRGYDPDRAAFDRIEQYGLAFGAGAHKCLGTEFTIGVRQRDVVPDPDIIGVAVRLFALLVGSDVQAAEGFRPEWDGNLTMRPTWTTFPATIRV